MKNFFKIMISVVLALTAMGGTNVRPAAAASGYEFQYVTQIQLQFDRIVRYESDAFAMGKTMGDLEVDAYYQSMLGVFVANTSNMSEHARHEFERVQRIALENVTNAIDNHQPISGLSAVENVAINGQAARTVSIDVLDSGIIGNAENMTQIIRLFAAVSVAAATGIAISRDTVVSR